MSSFATDPNDSHIAVCHDHGMLSTPGIKAVRQQDAVARDVGQELIDLPEDILIEACSLFRPFFHASQAPRKLQQILPYRFLADCAELQSSFFQGVPRAEIEKAGLFYDVARSRPHTRRFHIEEIFFANPAGSGPPLKAGTLRARGLILSFSDASLNEKEGGETEIVVTDNLTAEQIASTIGNNDPVGSDSLKDITIQSISAGEALSFWGSSSVHTNPHTDYLVHRARIAGSKRLSLGLSAHHCINNFCL